MVKNEQLEIRAGKPYPLGATRTPRGVQFALVSRNATDVWLQLYRESRDAFPFKELHFDSRTNRTGDVWHVEIVGLKPGALYMYRLDGPFEPEKGFRFNKHLPLLDPYARALTGDFRWNIQRATAYQKKSEQRDLSVRTEGTAEHLPKCIVVDDEFDWQDDRPLNYPLQKTIIYEAHIRGLSMHDSAEVEHPGTYRGVVEMIPYLRELGITSVEFLPIHEFDEFEFFHSNPITGEKLTNYWGYSTLAFFAPKASYAASCNELGQVNEFKSMVRELHKAGIEVILDVVFNHSGEGNEMGPTVSFRGIDNTTYYMLDENRRYYKNYSGCGNTMNCNNPVMRSLIMDALHYWVVEMHVDGFRFDLGSILGRDETGRLLENPPVLERIANDPILKNTKIIAEAWDAGGAYQVGGFPGGRWAEWNDRFRDDVRRYWRGDKNMVAALATRFAGSADLYHRTGRKPFHSINFVTSHDGYTLRDLVSYTRKHNEANGEQNRDGHSTNFSQNFGVEGETPDRAINLVRRRQMKNFISTLLLSLGTPMLLSGDEFARTQKGNNNAYCQNSELAWNDYRLGAHYSDIFRFTRLLIALRKNHPAFTRGEFYTGVDNNANTRADVEWFSAEGTPVDWAAAHGTLAVYIDGSEAGLHAERDDDDFYIMFNATKTEHTFVLPPSGTGRCWVRVIDTARDTPHDLCDPGFEDRLDSQRSLVVANRSLVLLQTKVDAC